MVFISEIRHNPTTGKDEHYYRLRESFRDLTGRVRQKVLVNIGFEPEMTRGQMSEAAILLSWKVQQSRKYQMPALFESEPGLHYSLCFDPTESAAEIYRALGCKSMPFRKYTIKEPSPPPD